MSRRVAAIAVLVLLASPMAWAQHGGHPQPDTPGSQPKGQGPNLRIPNDLAGDVRSELKTAIAKWKAANVAIIRKGPKKARNDVDAAIDALEAVRPKDADCALPEYYLGIAYQLLGLYYGEKTYTRSIARLKKAIKLKPTFHEAMVELGDAYGHLKMKREAEGAYNKAIAAAPDYVLAYERRAVLRFKADRMAEALSDIRTARKLKPRDLGLRALERKLKLAVEGPSWPEGSRFIKESKNYKVMTNVSQDFADTLSENAELIRRLYTQIFPNPKKTRRKFPIVVFKSRKEYQQNGGPRGAGGHFDPVFKQLYLFQYRKMSDTLLVLYHEGFHQFLDGILKKKPPQWFNEGVADFFGPSQHVKEGKSEGMKIRPNPWRLKLVQRLIQTGRTVPFKKLMRMSQREMYGKDAGNHYAQSWSMIYFFCQADDRKYFKYMKKYFKALRRGKDRFKAYDYAFKKTDMSKLEARWRQYILRVR